jgi:two-component sensor histidine kinase
MSLNNQAKIDTSLALKATEDDLRIWLDSSSTKHWPALHFTLAGFDSTALALTTPLIRYTNLAGGEYILKIFEKTEHDCIAKLKLTVENSVFEQTWFRPLLALNLTLLATIMGVLWLFYDRRQQQLLQSVRNEFMQNMHDQTLGSLANILSLTKIAQKKEDPAFTKNSLKTINDISSQTTDFLRSGIHALNPENSNCDQFLTKTKTQISALLEASQIQVDWQEPNAALKKDLKTMHLSLKQYWHFSMIFKEITNNIMKHSQADQVTVSFAAQGKEVLVTIVDNGKGFDQNTVKHGYGQEILLGRARMAHSELKVTSEPNKGTQICFTIPPL